MTLYWDRRAAATDGPLAVIKTLPEAGAILEGCGAAGAAGSASSERRLAQCTARPGAAASQPRGRNGGGLHVIASRMHRRGGRRRAPGSRAAGRRRTTTS
jgi:hypothetical protein